MKIEAVILAGGRGTRLAPMTDHLPKPMVPVRGKPIVQYVLEHLKRHGIRRVALSVSYLGDMIEEAFGDGSQMGMEITYLKEPYRMGTGGWTQLIDWSELADQFLVLNADNIFWMDVDRFRTAHQASGGIATIAAVTIPSQTVSAAELLLPTACGTKLQEYVDRSLSEPRIASNDSVFVSSGWYMLTPKVQDYLPNIDVVSMETDIWPALSKSPFAVGFYDAREPWFDTGTHERLARIEHFLETHPEFID